ncbi:MAG: DNA polymerase III subunit gamma/tau [Planctomycetaceae bacterium]
MEYTVLARRFRPQSFDELIGQEHVAQALRNAVTSGRVAHAYLFTGARGVGKTSAARILAKALNCPQSTGGDPCNRCEICQAIAAGGDVDVLEIDGASNRGIDEIRDVRANVGIKPMRSRYKVYIIDEVHMLTTPAFNALLKTLEEPPGTVKFIFCTTEPHKVPDTILSRCQRFDFGTIETGTICRRLTEIAQAEGVSVEAAAVDIVARRAAGSMRDSQSLFDQLLASGGKSISAADVHRLLGTASDERLVELSAALVAHDPARALQLLQTALAEGAQHGELIDQLLNYVRDLMVLAAGASDAALVSVSADRRSTLDAQARQSGLPTILAAMQILAETKGRIKGTTYAPVLVELALVQIASLDQLERLSDVSSAARNSPGTATALPPAPQKKTELTSGGGPQAGPQVDLVPDEGVEPAVICPFEAGREGLFWPQVICLLDDRTGNYARNASRIAISGPNQLVLTFPKSYHLSKQYLERPEPLKRMEDALRKVVGRPVRIGLAVDESEAVAADAGGGRVGEIARGPVTGSGDLLVQRALAAFGATVVRVDRVPGGGN